ncbi:hypothetical protein [Psychrobacter frigidicola]|uniref:hypothetical protein n=1 Tax=Psychrobacter frigidicola TaxID=45611 RepID=UPI0019195F33|nr:hypothetical protein [Psychrobacter frigidicola]
MLKRHLLLASVLAGAFAVTACSQQTEEQADAGNVESAAESAGNDIAANTREATTEAEIAAQNSGEDLADGARTAGAVAAGAVVNTGEAIADGANTVVEGTADAVAKGASSVADGASDVAANASAKPDTDLQADPAIKEAVSADQQY